MLPNKHLIVSDQSFASLIILRWLCWYIVKVGAASPVQPRSGHARSRKFITTELSSSELKLVKLSIVCSLLLFFSSAIFKSTAAFLQHVI